MIDLHCHVLPGLDDGPADLATAVDMVRAYAADGVETVVATPHLRADFPGVDPTEIPARCEALEAEARAEGVPALIVSGGEVALSWALDATDEELRTASFGGLGRDLLIETPPNPMGPGAQEALFSVMLRGLRVTLSHPELSSSFQKAPHRLAEMAHRGIVLQVTAGALLRSPRRSRSAALAQSLVRDSVCSVIASDAHSPGPWRPPELSAAAIAAARLATPARAEWLTVAAPGAILAGERLPPLPAGAPSPRGRRWLRRNAPA